MLYCKSCGQTTPTDDISDGSYLAAQYGWTTNPDQVVCPICNSGPIVGKRLCAQLNEIRRKRQSSSKPKYNPRKKLDDLFAPRIK